MTRAAPRSCLLVTRDAAAWRGTFEALSAYDVELVFAADLTSARAALRAARADAVLIDGEELGPGYVPLLRALATEARAPVVVLLDPGDEIGQIMALEVGAAEVIGRTSSPRLLLARLSRLTTTADAGPLRLLRIGELELDTATRTARLADEVLPLTAGEFDVLLMLARQVDLPVNRDSMARGVGNHKGGRGLDMAVCRIRRKLHDARAASVRIRTLYGRGYALTIESPAARTPKQEVRAATAADTGASPTSPRAGLLETIVMAA